MDNTLLQSEVFRLQNLKNIIRAFPNNNKLQQLLVADDQGNLYLLEANGDQLKIENKQQISTGKDINYFDLLISPATQEKDRIIVTSGSQVLGLTKKLKEYLKHDTYSADLIQFAMIEGNQLFTAGEYMLNEFTYQNDRVSQLCFFLSPGKINCLQVHYLSSKAHPILGCQDSCVRILNQDQVLYVIAMTSPVICMHIYAPQYKEISSQNRIEHRRCFIFGLEDGTIVAADLGIEKANILFTFKVSSIAQIKPYDFFKTGKTDLIIARQDGIVEVYQDDELRIQKKINEGITSIDCGQFFNLNGPTEIIISTFQGRLLLLREGQSNSISKNQKEIELQIKQLKIEIADLQKQQIKDTQKIGNNNSRQNNNNKVQVKFKVSHKLIKNDKDGTYKLIIDSQYPIDMIVLNGQKIQKCYTIKDLKVSNYEILITQNDMYNIYVIPIDINSSQSFAVNVKPLGSYQSIHLMSIKHLPLSSLNLKGEFTKQDMIMWLNDLTDLQNSQEDTQTHLFRNAALDSYLQIKFKQGQALFKSDSISVIYTCRQSIMNKANERAIQVEVKWECKNESVVQYLQKIKTLYDDCMKIKKNYEILPAIKELLIDNHFTILSKEFQQIYSSEQELSEIYKELPNKIQYLEDLLIDTYTSKCNLKSQFDMNIENVKSLWKRDFQELIQYILK
ncbi:unnamed protein product [Paramecium sonneborni]|uniref:Uncharacterized protein n=1 Tax=Paramecium sonneborni TaxID=65129 RepID=A0A8S1PIV1_9CILI|nr:unnamed protein product [Paramecium sonneborni]